MTILPPADDRQSTAAYGGVMPAPTELLVPVVPEESFELPPVAVRDILFGSGPRFARDAFGPMLGFYVGWRLAGLLVGIAVSTAISLAAYRWERHHERPGLMARIGLGFVLVQAAIGLVSQSTVAYLAQPVLVNGVYGLVFLASSVLRRPLAGAFASETYPFPDEVRSSDTFRRAFGRISLVWGLYLIGRSALRLGTLSTGDVDTFIVVNLVTGVPFTALLMGWSVWYGVRFFRRSEEWGPAIRLMEQAQPASL